MNKICILVEENEIIAWTDPIMDNDEYIPSLEGGIIVDTPIDVDLGDCIYVDGEIIFSPDRQRKRQIAEIRMMRRKEFAKFDKYQLPYIQAEMTLDQIREYTEWRQAWLDAPETLVIPERPDWFTE